MKTATNPPKAEAGRLLLRALLSAAACLAIAPSADGRTASTGAASTEAEFVPGEAIVAFADRATPQARSAALDALPGASAEPLPLGGVRLVDLPAGTAVGRAVAELEAQPGVRYAQPNYIRTIQATPNDPLFGQLWGLHNTGQTIGGVAGIPDADIDAPEAWDLETGSAGTIVAIVDTGVDHTHPDLVSNMWSNPDEVANGLDDDGNGRVDDVIGWDFHAGDSNPQDLNGHGTHVAGTVGAAGSNSTGVTGVAWDVSLMPIRALGADGSGTDAAIAAGFRYAAREGADIVNASLGGPGESAVIADAVADHPETLFVVAAGNDSLNNDVEPQAPCNIIEANLICVAATDNRDQLATFSNYGLASVDMAAPGVRIRSTMFDAAFDPVYASLSGTSMATPHVAGAAALLRSQSPEISVATMRSSLLGSVDPKESLLGKVASGGRLNAARALLTTGAQEELPGGDDPPGGEDPPSDGDAPETRVTQAPRRRTRDRTPTFGFRADESKATFECRLNRRAWMACQSPKTYRLRRGRHVFRVRSRDAAGNVDPSPARRSFRVLRRR